LLTSGSLLFTELLLIRWIPSTVKYVGFFTNFLLMASFLGIGIGILLGRSGRKLPVSPFAWLLFGIVLLVLRAHLDVQVKSTGEIFFGLAESTSADTNFVVLPLVFVMVASLMAALALPSARSSRASRRSRPTRSTSLARWPASPGSQSCRPSGLRRSPGSGS
jgi:hypothetical protein